VGEVIETVALDEHDRVANKLSGGQRSRISLATALLAEPDLLVLDEPTVGLDPVLRVDLWNTFTSLAEAGKTLLVSSHVMDEAERCDSLLLMRDGDLLATETAGRTPRAHRRAGPRGRLSRPDQGAGGGLSPRITIATATRVLTQLRRDPRTIALLLVVPAVLLTLIKFVFDESPGAFDRIGGPLVGLFPFITMFLVTSITMLRERTTGTLERLMTMPLAKLDILLGYGLAFGLVGTAQALITSGFAFALLDLEVAGSTAVVILLAIGNALLGMSLGLFVSAFAQTEFQAIQFMPAFVFPQLLLCGLFVARDQMAGALEAVSYALPLTYAYDALDRVTERRIARRSRDRGRARHLRRDPARPWHLGAATLRRRTA
jgi:ABC transporter DrrB family efflux protein